MHAHCLYSLVKSIIITTIITVIVIKLTKDGIRRCKLSVVYKMEVQITKTLDLYSLTRHIVLYNAIQQTTINYTHALAIAIPCLNALIIRLCTHTGIL